ncbi:TPA: conjugal transfer protein TraH [Photobacterium damselae]|uniref:conjugal transfer protein TraH n=1 Tax=Photobacterium damselae TaxID=38293 RepID=UPI00406926FC
MRKTALTTLLLLLSAPALASVSHDLEKFFDGIKYEGNTTDPQSYQGQMANNYTGGSAYIRTPVKQAQIATLTLPEISAGCGGIDLFLGGFSHINSDQLIKMGKAIVANAVPFAADLALQTWAPQLKNVRDRLEAIAREINALSVNSCETAQAGASALAGFAGIGNKQYICATMSTQNNTFADWAAAKNGCNNEVEVDKQINNATNDNNLKDHIAAKRNIIWYSLKQNALIGTDDQLSEFLMSLSGTIVYDEKMQASRYPSLLTSSNNLIKTLTQGGEVTMYQCDHRGQNECLLPSQVTLKLTKDQTLKAKATKTLRSIIDKYRNDTLLSPSEQGFIDSVSLPVLKMMTVSLESGYSLDSTLTSYAEVIATDLVSSYLQDSLRLISAAIDSNGADSNDIDRLYEVIGQASEQMRLTRVQALQSLEAEQSVIEASMALEQRVEGGFSSQTRANLLFGQEE